MNRGGQTILLVEDDANDAFFLQYSFECVGMKNPVQVVPDGQQAINYLAGEGPYANRQQFPMPALVFLDLKLPVKMGTEVLRWIQTQPALANLLVVVLTSSSDSLDIQKAYDLGARSYLVKPVSLEKRIEMAQAIKTYWLGLVRIPA